MELNVFRQTLTSRSTVGQVCQGDNPRWYSLEPPVKSEKPCAIPPATYPLTVRWSPRFKRLMPHVENVPGFEGVLIHTGNYPSDTEACLLLGKVAGPDVVLQSHIAFEELWREMMPGVNQFDLKFKDRVFDLGQITYHPPQAN